MKTLTLILLALAFSPGVSAQSETEAQLEELYYQDQYDKIISKYAGKKDELSALSLYYVGIAYYMKDEEFKCIAFMDLSIDKDSTYAEAYYIKGNSLNYTRKHRQAVPCFEKAIALDADNYKYYTRLGDTYYFMDKYSKALEAYQKAMLLPECTHRAFFISGVIYLEQKEAEKALQYFYAAKTKAEDDMDAYAETLFNIGLAWIMKGDDAQAEAAYNELLSVKPDEYHAYARLIQIYYHRGEYSKATPFREKLYEAYNDGKLFDTVIEDQFCYDQFKWDNYNVMAFERYEDGPGRVAYEKQLFHFMPESTPKATITVFTEYIPGSEENGTIQYELCVRKGMKEFRSGKLLTGTENYETLKHQVLKLAGEHLE